MAFKGKIDQEINEVSSLRNLVEIYGEIASIRMVKIRAFVLKNRKFLEDIRKEDFEITIIGRNGRTLFLGEEPKRPYTFFELPDYGVNELKLAEVIRHLVQYEEIRVYYGQYQSVVTQKPTTFSISAGTPIREEVEEPKVSYIFEPTVEKILMFFETQIFASLFDQSIRESQLAKLASRILAMDRAAENIKKRLSNLKIDRLKVQHRLVNRRQLNSLSSTVMQ